MYIKNVTANSYKELTEIINNNGKDLRDNFVFRGLEDYSYDLIPSALRKENNKLNNFIDDDFELEVLISREDAIKGGFVDEDKIPEVLDNIIIIIDKNGKVLNWSSNKVIEDNAYLQIKKELYVLFKFLNFTDRAGLKVTNDFEIGHMIINLHFILH